MDGDQDFMSSPVVGGWRTMLLLTLSFVVLVSGVFLRSRYEEMLPKVPAPTKDMIYPIMPISGRNPTLFGTLRQTVFFHGLVISGFTIGALGIRHEERARRRL